MSENQHLRTEGIADSGQPSADIWRNEIHSRIAHFRNRRARRIEGAFSMRFPFPPGEEVAQPPEVEAPAKSPERNIRVTGIAAETAPPSVTVVAPAQPEVTEESIVATGPPEIAPESVPELLAGSGASDPLLSFQKPRSNRSQLSSRGPGQSVRSSPFHASKELRKRLTGSLTLSCRISHGYLMSQKRLRRSP